MVPIIDIFKCDGCGVCVKMCPPQVIGLIKEVSSCKQIVQEMKEDYVESLGRIEALLG